MASSTTNPTAIVRPISDRLSRLYPSTYIIAQVPSSASGTVMPGMMVAHAFLRKRKITSTTREMVSINVYSTSCTDALMVMVRSLMRSTLIPGGMDAMALGNIAFTRRTVSMTLAPGCLKIIRITPGLPFW